MIGDNGDLAAFKFFAFVCCACTLLVSAFSFVYMSRMDSQLNFFGEALNNPDEVLGFNYDVSSTVGCSSDSMGLSLGCGDVLYGSKVNSSSILFPGQIYIYRKNSTNTVVHRLVLCLDVGCERAIFKGDNNELAELVNRSDVLYTVDYIKLSNWRNE